MIVKGEWPQYAAEFIGTFFLVFFGCGAVILSEQPGSGIVLFVPIVFGGAVATMIYSVGHISGAHFNPAVTVAFWLSRNFPSTKVPGYIVSQMAGALIASITHFILWGADHSFGATSLQTTVGAGVFAELILSFVLMFVIISVATDSRAVGEMAGIAIGTTVALCAFVGGPLTSASMNPARSFGPAVLSGQFGDLWIYFLIPVAGTIAGAKVYEWIRCNQPGKEGQGGCC